MTNNKYDVEYAKLSAKKTVYDFGKELHYDVKAPGNKTGRDRSFISLVNWPAIMTSGTSTIILSSDLYELCEWLLLILQDKQAGNISNKINKEIVAIVDKLIEYNYIPAKQHKISLYKRLN